MKKAIVGLKEIKVGEHFELFHIDAEKSVKGIVEQEDGGYWFTYTRLNPEPDESDQGIVLLLSKEDELDDEDLRNVNEILEQERLNFVKWG